MKTILLALLPLLMLSACATTRRTVAPSTVGVVRSIQAASVSTVKAQASAQKARVSIKTAQEAVVVLEKTATPEQRPAVATVKQSLAVADSHVVELQAQLVSVSGDLVQADTKAATLQGQVDTLAADRDAQAVKAREYGSAYHRLKFWLALAAAGLAFAVALQLIPPLIPYRWGIAAGAAGATGIAVFAIL